MTKSRWLRRSLGSLVFVTALFVLGAPGYAVGELAIAELYDAQGELVGLAFLAQETAQTVRVTIQVEGLAPGRHGVHIHEIGRCEPPDFASAGGHFNPSGQPHGLENPEGPHAGDLPNLTVAEDGTGWLEAETRWVSLTPGPTSLFDADGSALVIHTDPDDQRTDPSGSSGARIACGVLERIEETAVEPPSAGGGPMGGIGVYEALLLVILGVLVFLAIRFLG